MSKPYFFIPEQDYPPSNSITTLPEQLPVNATFDVPVPRICLNMIVKNESKIILRLLESVLPIIDTYCICDTGSNDNTTTLIHTFFQKHNIPGKITFESFRNFEYNRTYALRQCYGLDKADYLLFLDADMVLELGESLSIPDFKKGLVNDAYLLTQGSDAFCYKNNRIVKNSPFICYEGVTHEYLKLPENSSTGTIHPDMVFIRDFGDGGSKADKFIRDIRLLTKGLEENPKNERYVFYLGNSFRDAGQYGDAIITYKKRVMMGGWPQEIWHSYYSMGNCSRQLGNMNEAIQYWLDAYQFFPERIENLYEIIHYYRKEGKYHLANLYYELAAIQRSQHYQANNPPDYLFLQKDVYEYKLDYEFSIIGFYANPTKHDIIQSCMDVLDCDYVPESIVKSILVNYKFYAPKIKQTLCVFQDIFQTIGQTIKEVASEQGFISSTPTLCMTSRGDIIANVRFVNYRISEDGKYETPQKIETRNVVAMFSQNTQNQYIKTTEFLLQYQENVKTDAYIGLDDMRIFCVDDKIMYNASRPISMLQMTMEFGYIDFYDRSTIQSAIMSIDGQRPVEKNWVFCSHNGLTKIIYQWYPLIVGERDTITSRIAIKNKITTPSFFKWIRGSTNGILIRDELWFICHVVSHEDKRYYYHLFVVLNSKTLELKTYSKLFTFEKATVEYTLGMVYLEKRDELLIGYSTMDRTTQYVNLSRENIDALF